MFDNFRAGRTQQGHSPILLGITAVTLLEVILAAMHARGAATEMGPLFWPYFLLVASAELAALALLFRGRRTGLYVFTAAHALDALFVLVVGDARAATFILSAALVLLAWTLWPRLSSSSAEQPSERT